MKHKLKAKCTANNALLPHLNLEKFPAHTATTNSAAENDPIGQGLYVQGDIRDIACRSNTFRARVFRKY